MRLVSYDAGDIQCKSNDETTLTEKAGKVRRCASAVPLCIAHRQAAMGTWHIADMTCHTTIALVIFSGIGREPRPPPVHRLSTLNPTIFRRWAFPLHSIYFSAREGQQCCKLTVQCHPFTSTDIPCNFQVPVGTLPPLLAAVPWAGRSPPKKSKTDW